MRAVPGSKARALGCPKIISLHRPQPSEVIHSLTDSSEMPLKPVEPDDNNDDVDEPHIGQNRNHVNIDLLVRCQIVDVDAQSTTVQSVL